jgi:hypothetical protein
MQLQDSKKQIKNRERLNRHEPSLEEQLIGRRQRQIRIRTVVPRNRGKREVELSLVFFFFFFIAFVLAVGSLLFSVLGFVSTFCIFFFVRLYSHCPTWATLYIPLSHMGYVVYLSLMY